MMSHIKFVCISLLMLVLLNVSCVEEYTYSTAGNDQIMVVEGYISDKIGDQKIRLSYSGKINSQVNYIDDAHLVLRDDLGSVIEYVYTGSGFYEPIDQSFISKPSRSYSLSITQGGNQFVSEYVTLPKSLEIEDVSWVPTRLDSFPNSPDGTFLTLKVKTNADNSATDYYRYDICETFELETLIYGDSIYEFSPNKWEAEHWVFNGSYFCREKFENYQLYQIAPPEVIEAGRVSSEFIQRDPYGIFPCNNGTLTDSRVFLDKITFWDWYTPKIVLEGVPRICYRSNNKANVKIFDLENRVVRQIVNEPVYHIQVGYNLSKRYSVLVKQYALPQGYYQFQKLSEKFSVDEESLYRVQPGFVQGNIRCTTDESVKVVGYFYASTEKEQRIYIDRADLGSVEQIAILNSYPRWHAHIDSIPTIDSTMNYFSYWKEVNYEVYQYLITQRYVERSESIKYFFQHTKGVIFYFIENACCDMACNTKCDFVYINPEWCYDCRYFGSEKKPDFWEE